jgi:hypothetical protein
LGFQLQKINKSPNDISNLDRANKVLIRIATPVTRRQEEKIAWKKFVLLFYDEPPSTWSPLIKFGLGWAN